MILRFREKAVLNSCFPLLTGENLKQVNENVVGSEFCCSSDFRFTSFKRTGIDFCGYLTEAPQVTRETDFWLARRELRQERKQT